MQSSGVKFEVNRLMDIVPSFHLEVELLFLLSGEAELIIEDDSFTLVRNSVVIVNSEKRHSLKVISPGLVCRVVIDYQTISEYLGSNLFIFFCNSVVDKTEDYSKLISILQKIIATKLTREGVEDFGTYSLYYQLLDVLSKKYLIDQNDIRYRENHDEASVRIHEIIYYMQKNYNHEITLNELADRLYLSNAYLSRFFKKNFGQNFKDYLNGIRLLHAIDDLLQTDKNMTKIAMDNGFPSVSRFNQVFKDAYEVSPLAYREQHVKDKQHGESEEETNEDLVHEIKEYIRAEHITNDEEEKITTHVIDVTNHKYIHKNWNRAINVGPLDDVMLALVQRDILRVHEDLGISYIRFWNLFENFIVDDSAKYNFNKIDRTIEFLLHNHMKPFIVLGGKERSIMESLGKSIFLQDTTEKNFLTNPTAWNHLMKSFCKHLLDAFGVEEVSTWAFEIRKPKPWENVYTEQTESQYIAWLDTAVSNLRRYFPLVMIGGCEAAVGWNGHSDYNPWKILSDWKEVGFKPDFFSIGVYPYEGGNLSMNGEYLRDAILQTKAVLEKNNMGHVPIMVTEWSNTLSSRSVYNETCYKGAYIIQNLTMNTDIADKIMYWNASDVFGEFADTGDILYGGVGLLNKHGIPKPSFWAFDFMKSLYKYQIFCTRNVCATADGNGNYRLLFNNMKSLSFAYSMNETEKAVEAEEYEYAFDDLEGLSLRIQLRGVQAGEYEIRRRTVSKECGSILDELIRWNCVSSLKHQDIDYLRQMCQPKLTLSRMESNEERLNFEIELIANAFELVEISYCSSENSI